MGRGLIMGIVIGIAALVVSVIIAFVVVSQIAVVHEGLDNAYLTAYVANESGNLNETGYTLDGASETGFTGVSIFEATNGTDSVAIPLGNVSVTTAGVVTNASNINWLDATFSYTYSYAGTEDAVTNMRSNFTAGIDEVSEKIPTVLLIAAVVLILGILVLLWTQYKRMDMGSQGGGI